VALHNKLNLPLHSYYETTFIDYDESFLVFEIE